MFLEVLFSLFEPMIGSHCIQYANGSDWEERRKALYPTLRDEFLEGYLPCFIKVNMSCNTFVLQMEMYIHYIMMFY